MWVLSRKCHEVVVVGGAGGVAPMLKVTVLEIRAGKVKLGFDVAADVPVRRLEAWDRIHAGAQSDSPMAASAAPGA